MEMAKVTSKGQITIPVSIRRRLEINEGDKLLFLDTPEGVMMVNSEMLQGGLPQIETIQKGSLPKQQTANAKTDTPKKAAPQLETATDDSAAKSPAAKQTVKPEPKPRVKPTVVPKVQQAATPVTESVIAPEAPYAAPPVTEPVIAPEVPYAAPPVTKPVIAPEAPYAAAPVTEPVIAPEAPYAAAPIAQPAAVSIEQTVTELIEDVTVSEVTEKPAVKSHGIDLNGLLNEIRSIGSNI